MKEIKTFFDKQNCLNKGYIAGDNLGQNTKNFLKKNFDNVLPPVEVMQEYETLYPGTLSKLLDIAEKEQKHRHQQEIDLISANKSISELDKYKLKLKNNIIVFLAFALVLAGLILVNLFSKNAYIGVMANIVILIISAFFIQYHIKHANTEEPEKISTFNLNNAPNFYKKGRNNKHLKIKIKYD